MEFIDESIQVYAEQHSSAESFVLKSLNRYTHAHVLKPRMLSGHLQGRVLSMVSHMIQPKRILEIGTYTGYSAICLAEGLAPDGRLITIDVNDELEDTVQKHFADAQLTGRVELKIGKAADIIPTLQDTFDLVFIDADKESYGLYYDLIISKVKLGGFILADNVLWSGKVLETNPDKDTMAITRFNRKIQEDQRVENVLLPIRDGIMMIRKVSL